MPNQIQNPKSKEPDNDLEIMRHSAAHLLAAAVQRLYPGVKFGIGPAIENGFYYDFEFPKPISDNNLEKIEVEMEKIKGERIAFEREEISVEEAKKFFKDQPYKLELIEDLASEGNPRQGKPSRFKNPNLEGLGIGAGGGSPAEEYGTEKVSIYRTRDFIDLCRGPHVEDTSRIGAFKLQKIAGAYWRGDEKNPMLTRIYGTAFETQEELDKHLAMLAEAEKRDHRKIGKELDLFSFHPAAPGDIFWHPKGLLIINELIRYWRDIHRREGYVEVRTPEILTREIWNKSGHTKVFAEKMYKVTTPDAQEWNMAVKPMNCDGGILIYKSRPRSYKEFPLRVGELGVVHRYESSGELHGILRPREFTQDDAHIYCTPNQVKDELKKIIDLCFEVYDTFGLELDRLELSTRPENSIGSDEVWERAESIMREVLKERSIPHQINEGEGAFYGPKLDFHLKDSLRRTWQCATIQLDFAQPENFDLEYVTKEGTKERPVMIHRVVYGSIERFLGILIENSAGDFPVWLAPIQAVVIPVSEKQFDYARKIKAKLKNDKLQLVTSEDNNINVVSLTNLRVEIDASDETMEKKIRNAQLEKIPYMLVVGNREEEAGDEISVRLRSGEDLGAMKIEEFKNRIVEKIDTKSLEL